MIQVAVMILRSEVIYTIGNILDMVSVLDRWYQYELDR